jgi:hypothetical protein
MWETDEVETITRMLEQEVARRLTDEGVDLILQQDKFSKFDGYTERGGKRISVCEVKTRTEPLAYFEGKGSFLFDAAKLKNLLNVARLERLKAVLFVMTGDERLYYHSLKAMPKSELISARLNHHSTEYVEKHVCLIPLEEFTEIVPKVKEVKPDDIPFTGGRSQMSIEGRYRSEEILEYYRERKAIAMEDGGLCEASASAQAERETSQWILSRLAESTDKLFKL